ncbi:MAG: hypothetical protein KBT06_00240 [Prevotellaceae bacterium]|nr:hypothetical protein [Candidatus Colivivens equi]
MKNSVKKGLLIISILIISINYIEAQVDCYKENRSKGITCKNKGDYTTAKKYFTIAKNCPDKPIKNDLDALIRSCNQTTQRNNDDGQQYSYSQKSEHGQLSVNYQTDNCTHTFPGTGGVFTFSVSTDASGYDIEDLPRWCSLEKQYPGSFTIKCLPNEMAKERSAEITVEAYNGKFVIVHLIQQSGNELSVDGKNNLKYTFSGSGGTQQFEVKTSLNDYDIVDLPKWCKLSHSNSSYFIIQYDANNTGNSRNDSFYVVSGTATVTIEVYQPNNSNNVSQSDWELALESINQNFIDNYKGESVNGLKNGLGVLYIPGRMVYFGSWYNNMKNGVGLQIELGDESINGCPNAQFYMGDFRDDKKNGTGTCYDAYGTLVYDGTFKYDEPTQIYPNHPEYTKYRFEFIRYSNGNFYLGETVGGKRNGKGILVLANGNCWYGEWTNGERDGSGFFIPTNGEVERGRWRGDEKID